MSIVWKALQSVLVVFAQCRIQNTIWSTFLFLEEHILFKFSFLSNLSWLSLVKSLFYFIFLRLFNEDQRVCLAFTTFFLIKLLGIRQIFFFIFFFNIPKSNHHLFYHILSYFILLHFILFDHSGDWSLYSTYDHNSAKWLKAFTVKHIVCPLKGCFCLNSQIMYHNRDSSIFIMFVYLIIKIHWKTRRHVDLLKQKKM